MFFLFMTNHTHLMIETGTVRVSEIMRRLNLLYTKYFNTKYNLVGHLLQGRYFAELVESDGDILDGSRYILDGSRYIHLNPVRANMFDLQEEYRWSSYAMYIGLKEEALIDPGKLLYYFSGRKRLIYKEYVESAVL